VVYLSSSTWHDEPERSVRDRPQHRAGGGAQPPSSASAIDHPRSRSSRRLLVDRHSPRVSRTDVRRAHHPDRRHRRRGLHGKAVMSTMASRTVTAAPAPALTPAVSQRRAIRMVLWYQRLMEGRPSPCRFTPTCSSYALEALELHGTRRGMSLTLRRLLRCRPLGPSGWDPVPEAHGADCQGGC
jgi:putative membrane protein insertion efficiency factor